MRLILCAAVLAAAVLLDVQGFPADPAVPDAPRKPGVMSNNKPDKPRPGHFSKPSPQVAEGSQGTGSFILETVAQSTVSSELPSPVVPAESVEVPTSLVQPAHDPILETKNNFPAPESIIQDNIPETKKIAVEASEMPSSLSGKQRRHAGVEASSVLRIGDFEDVEANSGLAAPEYPATHEQIDFNQELSKEELILMAMENAHVRPQGQSNLARPAPNRPNLMASGVIPDNSQSHFGNTEDREEEEEAEEDPSENESTVDLRNGESPATIVQEPPNPAVSKTNPSSKVSGSNANNPEASSSYTSGSRHKPRPYGMDRPSKNRPTLDSHKNEHFGLPHSTHNDYMQKGETNAPDIFPSFWAMGRNKKDGMAKSDQGESCEDDDVPVDGVRSPVIQNSALCQQSGVTSSCHTACVNNGYASGSCLGPYPTPGCLCRMPRDNEYGVIYTPLEKTTLVSKDQDLQQSVNEPCKKCDCLDSCKNSGSFTGFCADKCYCGVPWFTRQL